MSFCHSLDGGRSWLLGGEVKQTGTFGPIRIGRPNAYEYPAGSTSGQYGFRLRVVLRGRNGPADTTLKALRSTNTTMLNGSSRPWLEVGDNEVPVACGTIRVAGSKRPKMKSITIACPAR